MILNVVLVYTLLQLTSAQNSEIGDLVQVSIVHRHGARNPNKPYPYDPWKSPANFPEGWMEMTAEGRLQMVQLGQLLRQRYATFLPQSAEEANVLVRSTDTNRTIKSAVAMMSGLFPNQTATVYVLPKHKDDLFNAFDYCPAYDTEMLKIMSSEKMVKEQEDRRETYDWIGSHLGTYIKDVRSMEKVYSCLFIENSRGFVLPTWTKRVFPEMLKSWAAESMVLPASTDLSAKLRFGSLFKDIFHHAAHATDAKSHKFLAYSAHDKNIAGMMTILKKFDYNPPGFAAAIIFETYEHPQTKVKYIRMFYRNHTTSTFHEFLQPYCGSPCILNDLRTIMSDVIPENIEHDCDRNRSPEIIKYEYGPFFSALCVSIFVFGALLAVFVGSVINLCIDYNIFNQFRRRSYESL